MTTEDFIVKAKNIHGDKYDYSKVEYTKNNDPVIIVCDVHGEFSQIPMKHLSGHGCKQCRCASRDNKRKLGVDNFIKKSKETHGDKYEYDKVVYKNNRTNVIITCLLHGDFEQSPYHHMAGDGCPKCAVSNRKNTMMKRYGVEHALQSTAIYEKTKQKWMNTLGVDNPMRNSIVRDKIYESIRKNKTYIKSKPEEKLYLFLCDVFGEYDVIRQYKSKEYPFMCDFYIKSRNLYIELNACWTHGGHWFDSSNPHDVDKVCSLKDSATTYYDTVVYTWTVNDVKKRNCARDNDLNYVVFWDNTLDDAIQLFKDGCPDRKDWL